MNALRLLGPGSATSVIAIGMMLVVLLLVLPVPPIIMDIGLTLSIALAVLVFVTAVFIEKPLDFSSFPSVLLASLMLRLALNVSSTKLIISEGHTGTAAAGDVIQGFAMFIMGGNLGVGLVVFAVLVIVNFMVITKGAGRMAEVGARFALDAMPGRQLAIDSDLAVGAISHEEASRRRELEQQEAAFLGSLDGASKFVKGDAIAGLLITALNLVAGMIFGLTVHGLSFGEAMQNYSILTVGDGLVSQIPAVIVSVAAAMLLSKGRDGGPINLALVSQLGQNTIALSMVSGILAVFALLPGLPFIPFLLISAAFGFLAWMNRKRTSADAAAADVAPEVAMKPRDVIGDRIFADEIHLEVAPNLVDLVLNGPDAFESRIDKIRRYIAEQYGFVLPSIRITDNPVLESDAYNIRIQSVALESGKLRPGCVLALVEDDQLPSISGERVREPVYRAAARWVSASRSSEVMAAGLPAIEPVEVLATHLLETIQANFSLIFNRSVLMDTLDALTSISDSERAAANRQVLDEYIPAKVTSDQLLAVLRQLLEERISIRNMFMILETVAEAKPLGLSPASIAEHVRRRLSFQITDRLKDRDGRLPIVQLSPDWEKTFSEYEVGGDQGQSDVALPPDVFSKLTGSIQTKLNEAASKGIVAVIATSSHRRRFLRTVLASKDIRNAVLAYDEIKHTSKPYILGVV